MRGVGTIVNVITVVAGTTAGVAVGDRLPDRMRTTVLEAIGLLTLVIGLREGLVTRNIVFPVAALVLGGLIGEAAHLEDRMESVGDSIRRRVERRSTAPDDGRFVEGFVAASLLFCVGPLTILGSIQDGLGGHDHAQLLLVKAALDGVVAIAFASTLGWGVGFSALTIVVVQGGLTLAAGAADRALTDRMVTEMSAAGGVMILGIGLRLLELKRVRVGSLLPALVVAPLLVAIFAR